MCLTLGAGMRAVGLILAAVALAAAPVPAVAQTLVDGSMASEITNLAQRYGTATLDAQADGNPRIAGEINGIGYQLFFMNCSAGPCEDVNFYAGFGGTKPTLEAINAWNRDKRFGNAYLDVDGDAVIEADFNLEGGVSPANFEASFALWALLVGEFAAHVGYIAAE